MNTNNNNQSNLIILGLIAALVFVSVCVVVFYVNSQQTEQQQAYLIEEPRYMASDEFNEDGEYIFPPDLLIGLFPSDPYPTKGMTMEEIEAKYRYEQTLPYYEPSDDPMTEFWQRARINAAQQFGTTMSNPCEEGETLLNRTCIEKPAKYKPNWDIEK